MVHTVLGVLLTGTALLAAQVAAAGYCDDPERSRRWETMSRQHPDDFEIQTLDALRIGLCQKVNDGILTDLEMVRIFWSAREQMLADGSPWRTPRLLFRIRTDESGNSQHRLYCT